MTNWFSHSLYNTLANCHYWSIIFPVPLFFYSSTVKPSSRLCPIFNWPFYSYYIHFEATLVHQNEKQHEMSELEEDGCMFIMFNLFKMFCLHLYNIYQTPILDIRHWHHYIFITAPQWTWHSCSIIMEILKNLGGMDHFLCFFSGWNVIWQWIVPWLDKIINHKGP